VNGWRFNVFTAVTNNSLVFWDETPCSGLWFMVYFTAPSVSQTTQCRMLG
jgi:hypothetical protein